MKSERTSRDEISKKIVTARTFLQSARSGENPPAVRFTLAYEAARVWCETVVRAEGLRVSGASGHHERTIRAAAEILGTESKPIMLQLDRARKARNAVMYEGGIETVSAADAEEFIGVVDKFEEIVTAWLKKNHPDLLPIG